jgi:hypothetical protein
VVLGTRSHFLPYWWIVNGNSVPDAGFGLIAETVSPTRSGELNSKHAAGI